ncbi:MAG: hypothetical protein R3D98_08915 [Candidatus Krumholzibacteriia bacterium]
MRRMLVTLAILAACAGTGHAQDDVCDVDAACTDGVMTVTVALQNILPPADYLGVLVYRTTLGQCDSEILLTPDAPLPLPQEAGVLLTHTLTDAGIVPGLGYHYRAVLLDLAGDVIPWFWPYTTRAVAGCGAWPIARGTLIAVDGAGWGMLLSCDCWFPAAAIDLSAVDPAVYTPLVGQLVELRGEAHWEMMPGSFDVIVESIAPVASCDEPVGAQTRSWSAVKRLYD